MKYYAVKKGLKPGIYATWDECKEQVNGFSGAEYKSFKSLEEANQFMYGTDTTSCTKIDVGEPTANIQIIDTKTPTVAIATDNDETTAIRPFAFVDGSFNPKTNVYGFGGFLINKTEKYILQGSGKDPEMASMRNVSGEILGSMAAIAKAVELGLPEIDIHYDYMGIEMWATGSWKRNKKGTIEYYNFIQNMKSKIKINFIKVAAHTGIPGNEEADQLAKQAVGI